MADTPKTARVEQEVAIASLKPAAYNPRKISPSELAALKEGIARFGFADPVVANSKNRVVVGGHQRLKAAEALGMTHVPVAWVSLTKTEEKALNLALNRIGGEFDDAALKALLADLATTDLDLGLTDFGEEELAALLGGEASAGAGPVVGDPDHVPEKAPSRVSPGQLWRMGEHLLLCGDATKPEDYVRLLGAEVAHMMLTDPPYNVDYEGGTAEALTIANDNLADAEFHDFLLAFYRASLPHVRPGGALYVWHAYTEGENFRKALRAAGWLLKQTLIWVKSSLVLGRQDYQWRHEPCLYGWRPGAAHFWHADRKQTTVLEFDKPSRNGDHPTMKPVDLFAYQMGNSTKPGEVVLDPFAGSGTTMAAAQVTGRQARLIELSPIYCDRILARYEHLSGEAVELVAG